MASEGMQGQELEAALARFRSLLDREDIDARQEHPPATIYTPWVVVWLMVSSWREQVQGHVPGG